MVAGSQTGAGEGVASTTITGVKEAQEEQEESAVGATWENWRPATGRLHVRRDDGAV